MKLEVIVKDKESGAILQREECDGVVCAYSGQVAEDSYHSGTISVVRGNVMCVMSIISAIEERTAGMKKKVCENFKEASGMDLSYEKMRRMLDGIETRIEVDRDAIREMKERQGR